MDSILCRPKSRKIPAFEEQIPNPCMQGAPYTDQIRLDFAAGIISRNCLHPMNLNLKPNENDTKFTAFTVRKA
jgi:hypothetical protein